MENKEFAFKGVVVNGFVMLFVNFAVLALSTWGIVESIIELDASDGACGGWLLAGGIVLLLVNIIMWCGFMMLERGPRADMVWKIFGNSRSGRILLD